MMVELIFIIALKIITALGVLVGLIIGVIKLWQLLNTKPKVRIMTDPKVQISKLETGYLYTVKVDVLRFDARKEGSFGITEIMLKSNAGSYKWKEYLEWGYDPIHEDRFEKTFETSVKVTKLKGNLIFTTIFGGKIKAKIKSEVMVEDPSHGVTV
jgi:hypothetical protein